MKDRFLALTLLVLAAMFSSCTKENGILRNKRQIKISVSASGVATKADASPEKVFTGPVEFSSDNGSTFEISMAESENSFLPFSKDECITKAEVVTTSNITKLVDSFALDIYPESCSSYSSPTMTSPVSYSGKTWELTSELFWPDEKEGEDERLNFWAYLYPDGVTSAGTISHTQEKDRMLISYTAPTTGHNMADAALLKDLLYAYTPYSDVKKGDEVPIRFRHAMAAVQFEVGNLAPGIDITGVEVFNVLKEATCVFEPKGNPVFAWSAGSTPKMTKYSQSFNVTGASASRHDRLDKTANASLSFFLIPQDLEQVGLVVYFKNASDNTEHSVSVCVNGVGSTTVWKPGHVYTYMISGGAESINVSVDDQVTGNVKQNLAIKNTGNVDEFIRAAIVADWYDASGNIVAPWSESDGSFENLCPSGWVKGDDGFYYTTSAIKPGNDTPKLFTKYTKPSDTPATGAHLEMEILVQAVKAVKGKAWDQISW